MPHSTNKNMRGNMERTSPNTQYRDDARARIEKDKKAKNPAHVYVRRAQEVGMDEEYVSDPRSPGHIAGQRAIDMREARRAIEREETTRVRKNKEGR